MVAGHLLPQIQILFCREEDIHWCRPVGGFVRTADLGCWKMLRDARTTASVKLRRGVVNKSQGRQWAENSLGEPTATNRI